MPIIIAIYLFIGRKTTPDFIELEWEQTNMSSSQIAKYVRKVNREIKATLPGTATRHVIDNGKQGEKHRFELEVRRKMKLLIVFIQHHSLVIRCSVKMAKLFQQLQLKFIGQV
jgi:hypothetical protein